MNEIIKNPIQTMMDKYAKLYCYEEDKIFINQIKKFAKKNKISVKKVFIDYDINVKRTVSKLGFKNEKIECKFRLDVSFKKKSLLNKIFHFNKNIQKANSFRKYL